MPARRPVLIVEGGGDASAVPLLVRRITEDMGLYDIVPSSNPLQAGDASVLDREGRLEKFVSYASRREDGDSVLIALDFDVFWTQCVANIARGWSERIIANAFPQRPVAICFFVHEYEALILKSLSDVVRAYPNRDWHVQQAVDVQNPEAIRGTKEAICRMLRTGTYKPSTDQARFTAAVNMEKLNDLRCFARLRNAIDWLYNWNPQDGFCSPI